MSDQTVEIQTDLLDPARARALQIVLGDAPSIATHDTLPAFFHQVYFWTPVAPSGLGRDGHPKVGGLIPDMGLPRRMWAGGRLTFHTQLQAGHPAERRTIVETQAHKAGRSGPLGFVTLRHDIWQRGICAVTEWQDLVYREDPKDSVAPAPRAARTDETALDRQTFDTTRLFRYSALTFNGHRIHYDLDYARDIEGYDGLVVHGPLLAHLLMRMAERQGPLKTFQFRATAPLIHVEHADLAQNGNSMWVRGPDGRLCMTAAVTHQSESV